MARADGVANIDSEFALYIHLRGSDLFLSNETFLGRNFSLEQLFHLGIISIRLLGTVLLNDEQEEILQDACCRVDPSYCSVLPTVARVEGLALHEQGKFSEQDCIH